MMKIDEALQYLRIVRSDRFTVCDFPKERRQNAARMMVRLISRGFVKIVGKRKIRSSRFVNIYEKKEWTRKAGTR